MITGSLRNQIDKLWTEFWTGGITNPLTVIEQISFLMFARLLDIAETRAEKRAARLDKPFKGQFAKKEQHLRWQNFKNLPAEQMLKTVRDEVFPHFRNLGDSESTFAEYMTDAQLLIQKPSLLVSAVNMIDALPLTEGDTKGDLYEYLLSKLTTAGINGQFRTPRHIIRLMVDLIEPKPNEIIGDPACGTAGFLVGVMQHLLEKYTSPQGVVTHDDGQKTYTGDLLEPYRKHIQTQLFHGYDFDTTMLRIAAMNLMLHGVESPDIHYQDTLSNSFPEKFPKHATDGFDVILANPPFKGSLDESDVHSSITGKVKTKKTELLFVALILRMLKLGGRSACIVPAGVLGANSSAHLSLRKLLVDDNQIEAIISLPHRTFMPYASVSTAIVVFVKGGKTDRVWGYCVDADGFSQDATRTPIQENDLPDVFKQWQRRNHKAYRPEDGKHGWFTHDDIVRASYALLPKPYLTRQSHKSSYPMVRLDELCVVSKGKTGAAKAIPGDYPLVTTSAELGSHNAYDFEGDAVCIPLVSSTGHGHASMKRIYHIDGKFAAATIVSVLQVKDQDRVRSRYIFWYLQRFKDVLLVPLMKGAANVSLSLEKISGVQIPLPTLTEQDNLISQVERIDRDIARLRQELQERTFDLECAMNDFGACFS